MPDFDRRRRKVCSFCLEHQDVIDYKEVARLRRYLSDRGKILPRRMTGVCSRHQRRLTVALKRARHIALLPYSADLRCSAPSCADPSRGTAPSSAAAEVPYTPAKVSHRCAGHVFSTSLPAPRPPSW